MATWVPHTCQPPATRPAGGVSSTGDDRRVKAGRCFVQTTGILVLFTVARTFGWLGPPLLSVGLLVAVLVLIAWTARATRDDLGLGLTETWSGLRYGAAALSCWSCWWPR